MSEGGREGGGGAGVCAAAPVVLFSCLSFSKFHA